MTSTFCQGLQSCLEPGRLVEPRVLRLKLARRKSSFSGSLGSGDRAWVTNDSDHTKDKTYNEHDATDSITTTNNTSDDCDAKSNNNVDMGGWSFLQSLSNTSLSAKAATENDKVYVHPLVKRTSSTLSAKSLEMCTESLGSESGSDGGESGSDEISPLSSESPTRIIPSRSSLHNCEKKIMNRSISFPPPLTSIRGAKGVQVRPHREGGRLVLEAVTTPSCHTYFHAERSEGRLRLRFLNHSSPDCDDKGEDEEEENDDYCDENASKDGGEQEAGEMEDDSGNAGDEMGMGKLPRPSGCKEGGHGNKGLLNWEPFWVAT